MRLLAAVTLPLALCTTSLAGAARNVDLLHAFAGQLPKVKRTTSVPVLLPPTLPLLGNFKVYATGYGKRYSWQAKDLRSPEKAVFLRMANQAIAAGPR
jgi:hypothetical protein